METNRDYYSWSQYSLWRTSKREFIKRYVKGEIQKSNVRFDKGKELAEYIETGAHPHYVKDPLLQLVADNIPKLGVSEEKLECFMPDADGNEIKLLSFLDSSDGTGDVFYEYKTGKVPWDQLQVDAHEQLDFYAAMIYLKYGKIPKCSLFWIETEDVEIEGKMEIRYTGLVERFERVITENDIVMMLSKIQLFVKQVDEYDPENEEISISNELFDRYAELDLIAKEAKEEMDLIKLRIQATLEEEQASIARAEKGWFAVSKRANYSYSKELTDKIKKNDVENKKLIAAEKKDGTAKVWYTESLRFNLVK